MASHFVPGPGNPKEFLLGPELFVMLGEVTSGIECIPYSETNDSTHFIQGAPVNLCIKM